VLYLWDTRHSNHNDNKKRRYNEAHGHLIFWWWLITLFHLLVPNGIHDLDPTSPET
jgi:hypothetical protein